jgi:hypothetical protein
MFNLEIPEWLVLTSGSHVGTCGVCLEECMAILSGFGKTDDPENVNPVIRSLGIEANDSALNDEDRTQLALTLGCQKDTADVPDVTTLRLAAFVCQWCADHLPETGVHVSVPRALLAAAQCLKARATLDEVLVDESSTEAARATAEDAGAAWAARAAEAAGAAEAAWAAEAAEAAEATGAAEAAEAAGAAGAARAAGAAEAARAAEATGAAGAAEAAGAAYNRDLLFATIEEFERLTGRTECATFSDEDWARVKVAIEGRP